jgi:hypothetical protein
MDWGTRRKLTVIAIFISILVLIGMYFFYIIFIKKPETCSDAIRNQNERGIDCGGVCDRMCNNDVSPVITMWQRPVKITDGVYSAIAYIENKNQNAGIQKLSYEMRMYDEKNVLITEPVYGETFVTPNSRSAIIENNIITGNTVPKTVFFTWKGYTGWDRVKKYPDQSFITSTDVTTKDIETSPKISATLNNKHTDYDYKNLPVIVIVYDSEKNIITTSNTLVDMLPHQSSKKVYFSWQLPFVVKPARVEIIPRINPFTI